MTDSLIIERTFIGTPERVYQALTDIDLLDLWLVPHPDMDSEILLLLNPGGAWRIHVAGEFTFEGTIIGFVENEFIEFTWLATPASARWAGLGNRDADSHDASTVRFEVEATEAGTNLTLKHYDLDVVDSAEVATMWDRCLGRLASIL